MADVDLHRFPGSPDAILQFIGKHHLRQLGLAVDRIGAVVLVPVHVVELDRLDAHVVAEAGHDHDPALRLFDAVKQHPAQHEVAVVVGAKLAFEAVDGQLLFRHLRDGRIATDALLRLLNLGENQTDTAVLGDARLRELNYAILKGEAGAFARQAFGAGNAIARSIAHVSAHLDAPISIDDMATRAGMSRAVFHRKFKQATTMAPIQFLKSMRLNNAAMKIAGGMAVNEAALDVGYVSPSQFSREFKRMYGQSPRQWSEAQHLPVGAT